MSWPNRVMVDAVVELILIGYEFWIFISPLHKACRYEILPAYYSLILAPQKLQRGH